MIYFSKNDVTAIKSENMDDNLPSVFVSGSIAFDVIFSVDQDFKDSINVIDGEIKNFNAVYLANEKKEYRGGTAGNIGFWLGKNKINSVVFSAYGKDFYDKGYADILDELGAKTIGPKGDYTATAYMISDKSQNQLIIWQSNSYKLHYESRLRDFLDPESASVFKIAIFSPGNADTIFREMTFFKDNSPSTIKIFDPGQMIKSFNKDSFKSCLDLCDVVIGNEVEFEFFEKFGLLSLSDKLQIKTLGAKGVIAFWKSESIHLDASFVEKVKETTGAGDAFRAGFISSLVKSGIEKIDDLDFDKLKIALRAGLDVSAESVKLPSAQY